MAQAFALDVLAALLLDRGDLHQAARACARGLQLYQAVGYREGQASALHRTGDIARALGDPTAAITAYLDALAVARLLGHPGAMAHAIEGLATVIGEDEPETAALLLGAGAALRARIGALPSPSAAQATQRTKQGAHGRLGPERLAEAWARGQQVPLADLFDLTRQVAQRRKQNDNPDPDHPY